MYIGVLNDKYQNIQIQYFKKNLKKVPTAFYDGNPFHGEALYFKYEELTSNGIDLLVSLSDRFYINNIVISFGEKSAPHGISLYDKEKSKCYDSYHAETGGNITASRIPLAVEGELTDFLIEFDSDFSHVNIDKIEIYGAIFEGEEIYPTPSDVVMLDGELSASKLISVSFDTKDGEAAFRIFADKLYELCGLEAKAREDGFVRFLYDPNEKKNGYSLCINDETVTISASDRKGMVQGVETLIKLISGNKVPFCRISDEPFCEFRGVHLFLPAEEEMDFAKHLIGDLLSPMGYNFIIMQFSAAMELESHPEINESFLDVIQKMKTGEWPTFPHSSVGGGKLVSKDSVRDLVAFAREYGIEIIPEVQSLGHVQYMTLTHPEIAEIPEEDDNEVIDERVADVRPKTFYKHSACPSNPKTYELLFDILDEIIDVVQPSEYVHMGHDEVYEIGVCPVCKHRDPSDLLAEDINRIHAHLKEKGLKMMIWADMLQNCTKYQTSAAIDKIPKDILLLDFIWYFHRTKDIEDHLLSHDFQILFGNMYSSHFPRFENRIRKEGVRGGQLSAWVKTSEYELGREGKLYDFLFAGQMLWSESYSAYNRFSYDKIISRMIPKLREKFQQVSYPSLEEGAKIIPLKSADVLSKTATDQSAEFFVNGSFRSLVFEHASSDFLRRIPWVANEKIGEYEVFYQDGSCETVPLYYGDNISHWDRRQNEPFAANYYRHNGYSATWFTDGKRVPTESGKEGTVYCYEWVNPNPSTPIVKIVLKSWEDVDTGVIVHRILGIE